jgi:hypothetical protein
VWRSWFSVLDWGSRGREFESRHSDKKGGFSSAFFA